jgi:hypothetical protein
MISHSFDKGKKAFQRPPHRIEKPFKRIMKNKLDVDLPFARKVVSVVFLFGI